MKTAPALKHCGNQAFTIMELLIVISLLGILVIASMLTYRQQIIKGHDAKRKEDLQTIKSGVEQYYDDFGCYPDADKVVCGSTLMQPYMSQVPCDPTNKGNYVYYYDQDGCSDYALYVHLANENDGDIAGSGCSDGCGPGGIYNYYLSSPGYEDDGGEPPSPSPSGYFGDVLDPLCDGSCIPNACVNCCPGSEYRCNGSGDQCIYDPSCSAP